MSTDEITIAGQVFTVPVRYAEGHVLTAGEASALNQTYHENLRNNFASNVKAARVVPAETEGGEAGSRELSESDVAALQAKLDEYAAEYQFGVRAAGSSRAPVDPVEREAISLAKDAVRAALKKQDKKADAEQVATLAALLVEKNPQFRIVAAQRIEASKAVAGASLDDILSAA